MPSRMSSGAIVDALGSELVRLEVVPHGLDDCRT